MQTLTSDDHAQTYSKLVSFNVLRKDVIYYENNLWTHFIRNTCNVHAVIRTDALLSEPIRWTVLCLTLHPSCEAFCPAHFLFSVLVIGISSEFFDYLDKYTALFFIKEFEEDSVLFILNQLHYTSSYTDKTSLIHCLRSSLCTSQNRFYSGKCFA